MKKRKVLLNNAKYPLVDPKKLANTVNIGRTIKAVINNVVTNQ